MATKVLEHTEGPWKVNRDVIETASGVTLARVLATEVRGEGEKNAKLMAAAPGLYELLGDLHQASLDLGATGVCEYCGNEAPNDEEGRLAGIRHSASCVLVKTKRLLATLDESEKG